MPSPLSFLTQETIAETPEARVRTVPLLGRLSLRARGEFAALGAALGLDLPARIGTCARSGELMVACLGPDEWLVTLPQTRLPETLQALAALSPALPHSAVDISGREIRFEIDGPAAADLLTLACPRDIASIAPGEARRTVFDGVTIVLWRDSETGFSMDVWNSFAPFVAQTLETGCRELAAAAAM